MKDAQAFWDKTAPRYASRPIRKPEDYERKLSITQEYFQADWELLEFGCGTGTTALRHAPLVKHYLATDISEKMVEIAREKARDAGIDNLTVEQGSLDSMALSEASFDAVLGLNILHLLEDVEATIRRVYSLLKPGGIFVSSTALIGEIKIYWRIAIPIMQALGKAPYVASFSKAELLDMLKSAGFVIDREWQPGKESVFIVAKKRD